MENKFENLPHEQKLKVAVFNEVRKICEDVGKSTTFTFERKSMDLISEVVWRKLKVYGEDLESFCKHAKRTTVTSDDVKLLVRRNAQLKAHIGKIADDQAAGKKGKQKKDVAAASDSTDPTSAVNSRANSPVDSEVFDVE